MPTSLHRIAIVANKTWECEPLLSVLLAKDARPATQAGLQLLRGYDPAEPVLRKDGKKDGVQLDPSTKEPMPLPPLAQGLALKGNLPVRARLSFQLDSSAVRVEVWCIEDWMRSMRWVDGPGGATADASSSSSYEKFQCALPLIREHAFGGEKPDLVIAFGTAGIPAEASLNGCVTMGSRVYLHDAWNGAPESELKEQRERFGPLLQNEVEEWLDRRIDCPRLSSNLFLSGVSADVKHAAEARFIRPPIHPAEVPRVLAGHGYAALGTINISDYDDYVWADEETLGLFEQQIKQREIGSMETTHGLIRLTWRDSAFLFVSGLTDRVPMFNAEVTPRKYAQNFAAAHNAGVVVAHLLPELTRLHSTNPKALFDDAGPTFKPGERISRRPAVGSSPCQPSPER